MKWLRWGDREGVTACVCECAHVWVYVFGCVHHGVKERERERKRERRPHHISSTKRAPAAKVFDRRHQKIPFYSVRLPLCIKGTSVQTLLATFLSSFR